MKQLMVLILLSLLIQGIKSKKNIDDQREQQENPLTSINSLRHILTDYRYFNQMMITKHLRAANRLSSKEVNLHLQVIEITGAKFLWIL